MIDYANFELQGIEMKDDFFYKLSFKEYFLEEADQDGTAVQNRYGEECTRIKHLQGNQRLKELLQDFTKLVPTEVENYTISKIEFVDNQNIFLKFKIKFHYFMQAGNKLTGQTKDIDIMRTFCDMFTNNVDEVQAALEDIKVSCYAALYGSLPLHVNSNIELFLNPKEEVLRYKI